MAKYNYDKSSLKDLSVNPFLDQVKVRKEHIEAAESTIPKSIYNPNVLARELHPDFLVGKIRAVIPMGPNKSYVIDPCKEAGFTKFPPFKAGQYASFQLDMGDKYACRPYSLAWGPKNEADPESNAYQINVIGYGPGHASEYIHNNWKEGTIIYFSSPLGKCCYEPLRDAKNVMAIGFAGEGLPMAAAVVMGAENYNLTIMSITPNAMMSNMCSMGFSALVKASNGRIKYVPVVLAGGGAEGAESGPVTAEMIKKYITDEATGKLIDTTFFVTGQEGIVLHNVAELKKLGIPQRRIRKSFHGAHEGPYKDEGYPQEKAGQVFNLRIWVRGEYTDTTCPADKSILKAIEDANVHIPSDCRSGECGWCHSRLIKGEYFMPKSHDGRREADRKFGWIHPCCSYPLSDIEIEVFPIH